MNFTFLKKNSHTLLLLVSFVLFFPLGAEPTKEEQSNTDLQAMYAQAFGATKKLPSQLELTLQIGRKDIAMIKVYSENRKTLTHLESKPFLVALADYIKPKYLAPLRQQIGKTSRVSLQRLAAANINTDFDQNSLSLKLLIPVNMRMPIDVTIGYARKKRPYPTDDELVTPANVSGYSNLTANLDHDYTTNKTQQRLETNSVLNIKGVVLESQNTWRNDRENQWSRNKTRVIIDRPKSLHRYTLGDIHTESRNYQQGIHLGGVSIQKTTELNPYLSRDATINQVFQLEQDSEVKIYINGFLKDKKKLDAGEYTLVDLKLESGANKIRLEVKNKDGHRSEQRFSLFNDASLMSTGVSSYRVEVGKPTRYSNKGYRYDDSQAILASGYYKKGLNNHITANGSFVSDGKSVQVGANAVVSTTAGTVTGRISTVKEKDKAGSYAVGLEYQHQSDLAKQHKVQLNVSGDYFDHTFSSLGYSEKEDALQSAGNSEVESRLYASVGKSFDNRVQLDLNLQRESYYGKKETTLAANVALYKSFENGGSVSTRLRYQNDRKKDKSINLRLHYPLAKTDKNARYKSLDTTYSSLDDSLMSTFFVSPKSGTGKDSIAGSLTHYTVQGSHSLNANLSYRGDRAEIGVSQQVNQSKYGKEKYQYRTKVKVRTAVSFADTSLTVSKPIQNSFAIVTGPKNQDRDIAVAKGNTGFTRKKGNELPDYYQSVIDKEGMPALINLSDYHYSSVNVDSVALPKGSDPETTEFQLKATYKQGYLLKAGGESGVIVDGTLVSDKKATPLSLEGGQFTPFKRKGKPIPFFTNRTGRFRLISVPPGKYHLELFSQQLIRPLIINIPNKVGMEYQLGKIKIATKG